MNHLFCLAAYERKNVDNTRNLRSNQKKQLNTDRQEVNWGLRRKYWISDFMAFY